jgi:aminoglycoside phosphotransferase (APT) family kinase protein
MTKDQSDSGNLPAGLKERLEQATNARVLKITPRGGGGASRFGAEIILNKDGRELKTYLAYNANRAGGSSAGELGSLQAFHREVSVLKALSGPARGAGVCVPVLLAADEATGGILTSFEAGEANYNLLIDPSERKAVSLDFMAQLACLHRIDISGAEFAALEGARPASEVISKRIAALKRTRLQHLKTPLIALALNWLEDNVPADLERNVLVHGDAGPANFLYADGKVTALLDWELTHAGDPHADLAMIAIRNIFQPFIPIREAFQAYEASGGRKVDLHRVRFYRVYFQTQFASPPEALNLPDTPMPPVFGTSLVYATVHMRVLAQALAEAMGIDLQPVKLPDAEPGPRSRSFEAALGDLKDYIVPGLTDQEASAKAKGLARLVKWWRDVERWGPAFEAEEREELSTALGMPFDSGAAGRIELCERILSRQIDTSLALRLCHAQVSRASALYADAMGAFAQAGFKPLD